MLWHPTTTLWIFTTCLQANELASVKVLLVILHILTGTQEVKYVVAFKIQLLFLKSQYPFMYCFQREEQLSFGEKQSGEPTTNINDCNFTPQGHLLLTF